MVTADGRGDLLLRGGTIVDPFRDIVGQGDVLIRDGEVVASPAGEAATADKTVDVSGCLVLPGLVDYHTHLFYGGTHIGIAPDPALLPQGVTTAVDQGSAGVGNVDGLFVTVANTSQVRVFAYLHVSPAGLATLPFSMEQVNPATFNLAAARRLFEKYGRRLLGFKVRQSADIVGEWGLEPLKAAIRMAEAVSRPVVVHTTNPPGDIDDLVSLLRPGDVFTHMYQGRGSTIIGEDGKVRRAVREARARGVVFDCADGRFHYALKVAKAAIDDGFEPDVISTDLTRGNLYDESVFGLPAVMSKYLALGVSLSNVVRACTVSPAHLLGMEGKIGTLAPGAFADVAVFRLRELPLEFRDVSGEVLTCNQVFIPQMTVLGGRVVYRSLEL